MRRIAAQLMLMGLLLGTATGLAAADAARQVIGISAKSNESAQAAQQEIDGIADQTRTLLTDFNRATRQLDDLRLYNAYLERQIASQQTQLAAIDASIGTASGLQRQIVPLTQRMIDALDQFIALDLPFRVTERKTRIAALRRRLDSPNATLAEKYNAVLDAYRIEDSYGRGIDTWRETLPIDGVDREVHMLRAGRVALLYLSDDGEYYGYWNRSGARWEALDDRDYRDAIRDGIRMANREGPATLLRLPVTAPEPTR